MRSGPRRAIAGFGAQRCPDKRIGIGTCAYTSLSTRYSARNSKRNPHQYRTPVREGLGRGWAGLWIPQRKSGCHRAWSCQAQVAVIAALTSCTAAALTKWQKDSEMSRDTYSALPHMKRHPRSGCHGDRLPAWHHGPRGMAKGGDEHEARCAGTEGMVWRGMRGVAGAERAGTSCSADTWTSRRPSHPAVNVISGLRPRDC